MSPTRRSRSRGLGPLGLGLAAFLGLLAGCSTDEYANLVFNHRTTCQPACVAGARCVANHCYSEPCGPSNPCKTGLSCLSGFCTDQSCDPACAPGQVCLSQVCVAPVPAPCQDGGCAAPQQCAAGFCVDTGCSPTCANGQVCLSAVCVDTSGGLSCAPPYTACATGNGDPYCADFLRDASNCGGCGRQCPSGELCNGAGACAVSCIASQTECNERCLDLGTDDQNCGSCANACPVGQVCSAGACAPTCGAPDTTCSTFCADTQVDPANCGACDHLCLAGQLCVTGSCVTPCGSGLTLCGDACVDLQFDDAHCAACGTPCGAGQRCLSGQCEPCGAFGELCCTGDTCANGICDGEVCYPADAGVTFHTLTIVAGGPGGPGNVDAEGTAARFGLPAAVVYDGVGSLFVADSQGLDIRSVDLSTGMVATLAGRFDFFGETDGTGTTARFGEPTALAYDGAGNLYVADQLGDTIRRVVVATGAVTTIAGSPEVPGSADGIGTAATFNGPDGLAYDDGILYVADSQNYTIRQIVLATGAVTTIAGTAGLRGSSDGVGAAARFEAPAGLVYDSAGRLYIADPGDGTIRELDLGSAAVSTIAGSPLQRGDMDGTGVAALFGAPCYVASDDLGHLFVSDESNEDLREVTLASAVVTTLAGASGDAGSADGIGGAAAFSTPAGVAYANSAIYLADQLNDTIRAIQVGSGAVTTFAGTAPAPGSADGPAASARFKGPIGLASDPTGNLYVADTGSATIRKIDPSGNVTTLAGLPGKTGSSDGVGTAASLDEPQGLACDGRSLFVADSFNSTIRRIDLATATVSTLAGSARLSGSADGTGPSASFNEPWAVACDGAGNLFVADTGNQTIRQIVIATGTVTTLAGSAGENGSIDGIGSAARFDSPKGLTCDGAGDLFVADSNNGLIRRIVAATGQVTTLAGSVSGPPGVDGVGTAAGFNDPLALVYDGAGHLYVSDTGDSELRFIDVATAQVTTFAGVYGQVGILAGPPPAGLNQPAGLAFGPGLGLFIADSEENVIVEIH